MGVEFFSLFLGLRVSYQIKDGWLGKEAAAVRPLPVHQGSSNESSNESA
jgi:hypothetical protein